MNLTPRGCSNIGGGLARAMEESRNAMMKLFCAYGYGPFNPAEFQLLEGTLKSLPRRRRERVIALSTPYGEPCCLRADITLSALSYMAAHHAPEDFPVRLCYAERIFSAPKAPKENLEDTQIGAELLGWEGPGADAEILAIILKALDLLQLDRSVVVLGDASIVPALFSGISGIPAASARTLIEQLQQGAYYDYDRTLSSIEGLALHNERILRELPWMKGGMEVLKAAQELFGGLELQLPLVRLARVLESLGFGERVRIDFGFVRDLDYYNGPIFNVYSSLDGGLLGGGGRYMGSVPEVGFSCQAVGFGLSLRELALARKPEASGVFALIWAGGSSDTRALEFSSRLAERARSFEISWNADEDESKRLAKYRGCRWWIDLAGDVAEELATGRTANVFSLLEAER